MTPSGGEESGFDGTVCAKETEKVSNEETENRCSRFFSLKRAEYYVAKTHGSVLADSLEEPRRIFKGKTKERRKTSCGMMSWGRGEDGGWGVESFVDDRGRFEVVARGGKKKGKGKKRDGCSWEAKRNEGKKS